MTCYFGRHYTCDTCGYRGDCDIYKGEKEESHEGEEEKVAD